MLILSIQCILIRDYVCNTVADLSRSVFMGFLHHVLCPNDTNHESSEPLTPLESMTQVADGQMISADKVQSNMSSSRQRHKQRWPEIVSRSMGRTERPRK
jgi:hypothetical protein